MSFVPYAACMYVDTGGREAYFDARWCHTVPRHHRLYALCLRSPRNLPIIAALDVCFLNPPPALQGFPWERHAPAWLPEQGWSPAFPGESTALAKD